MSNPPAASSRYIGGPLDGHEATATTPPTTFRDDAGEAISTADGFSRYRPVTGPPNGYAYDPNRRAYVHASVAL